MQQFIKLFGKKLFFICILLASSLYLFADDIKHKEKPSPLYSYNNKDFSLNLSAGIFADYTTFEQDQNSITQVGIQGNQFDLRAFRAAVYGTFNLFDEKMGYFLACGYSDYLTRDAKNVCTIFDATLFYYIANGGGRISVGKMKEPWSYEVAGDSAALMQHERFLSPLFQVRNIGIRYNNSFFDKRYTFAIGMYNDWIENSISFEDSGHSFTSRVTYIPYIANDNMNYLHLGSSVRYNKGDNNTLSYKGRPESNVADWYVDTGIFDADYALEYGLEALWSYNGFSVLGEYLFSNINSDKGKASLNGWYITSGWVLSGEGRPYNKDLGYAKRILPKGEYGALELIARYGEVNLNDNFVNGGKMDKWMLGANWWIDPYWKASISYGTVELDRFDLVGKTDIMLLRVQWFR